MFTQLTPLALQRCHWNAYDVAPFDQSPRSAVRRSPTRATPEIVGGEPLTGGA